MAVNGLNYTSGNTLNFTTAGVTRGLVNNAGNWGFGTLSPSSIVHISGGTDPLTIIGLGSMSEANILTIDINGVVGTRNDVFVSATISDNDITLSDSNSGDTTLSVSAITEVTYSDWGLAGSAFNVSAPAVELPFITGGSYNAGSDELTLVINGGAESNIVISGFAGADTFVTGGTIVGETLTLGLNDGSSASPIEGFKFDIAGDNGGGTIEMGDTLTFSGGTGMTVNTDGANPGSVTVILDDTAVTQGEYGSASETVTFTVDSQGRLVAASEQSISITASQVSDFDTEVLSSVFEDDNFVDSSEIDFTVTAGVSVTAGIKASSITNDMLAGSISNDKLQNSTFNTSGTTGTGSIELGGDIKFISTDGSVTIDNSSNGVFDIEVGDSVDTHVTGGTLTQTTGEVELTFNQNFGPITLTGAFDFVTGGTLVNNQITLEKNVGSDDVLGTINAVTGVTYNEDWDIALAGTGTVGDTPVALPFITGGTYSDGTLTLVTNNGLETIAGITGFKTDDTFLTGVTVGAGTGSVDFELNDAGEDFTASGFNFVTSGDSGTSTINLQGSLEIVGLDGITTSDNGSGQISIDLGDTTVSIGEYGSASETVTFTVDQQGRLTAASEQSINITASQVSDFDSAAEDAIFTDANFVDTSDIEFNITVGDSVSAVLSATTVSAGSYGSGSAVGTFTVDSKGRLTAAADVTISGDAIDNNTITFNGTTGSDPEVALNGTLDIISSDNSVVISGGSGTLDITISDANIDNIYTANGTLTDERTVTQDGNTLSFVGGNFTVDETTFVVDETESAVAIGASAPAASAVLEVASTTKGFLFPRMTETERGAIEDPNTGFPDTGLMVYQTDGDEGIYIYKSFGWVQVI
jgi:hypothetical protein